MDSIEPSFQKQVENEKALAYNRYLALRLVCGSEPEAALVKKDEPVEPVTGSKVDALPPGTAADGGGDNDEEPDKEPAKAPLTTENVEAQNATSEGGAEGS